MTVYLDREERLLLTLLTKQPLATWTLSGPLRPDWMATFNRLHDRKLVTPINDYNAYDISDAGKAALMSAHGPSFFDLAYRADDDEALTW